MKKLKYLEYWMYYNIRKLCDWPSRRNLSSNGNRRSRGHKTRGYQVILRLCRRLRAFARAQVYACCWHHFALPTFMTSTHTMKHYSISYNPSMGHYFHSNREVTNQTPCPWLSNPARPSCEHRWINNVHASSWEMSHAMPSKPTELTRLICAR